MVLSLRRYPAPSLCYNVTSKRTRKCKPILGWALLLPLPSSLSGAEDGEHLAETGFMALRLCLCGSPSLALFAVG